MRAEEEWDKSKQWTSRDLQRSVVLRQQFVTCGSDWEWAWSQMFQARAFWGVALARGHVLSPRGFGCQGYIHKVEFFPLDPFICCEWVYIAPSLRAQPVLSFFFSRGSTTAEKIPCRIFCIHSERRYQLATLFLIFIA